MPGRQELCCSAGSRRQAETVGNLAGSAVYGAATANGLPAVPRLIIGGLGAISTVELWVLDRRQAVKTVLTEELVLE